MDLRPLGTTGLRVSPVGLGTVKLGRDRGLKYAARIPTDDDALALLRVARARGVNLIDTAPAYGSSEERLGTLLPRVAPRDSWVLCTKAGESFDPATNASAYDFSPKNLRASVERSLTRLRVPSVDVVLLHFSSSGDLDERILRTGEAMGALRELQAKGLVRAVGASTGGGAVAGGLLAAATCDVVMVTLNSEDQSQLPVVEACHARGVGVLIKKALASGRAAGGAATLTSVLHTPGVSSAVVGTTNPAHLHAACDAAE